MSSPKIIRTVDHIAMGTTAARHVAPMLESGEVSVLGTATGGTPVPFYSSLRTLCEDGILSFNKLRTIGLDEYVIDPKHPESYRTFMNENFFFGTDIDLRNTYMPKPFGLSDTELEGMCAKYEETITRNDGVDLWVLGIGPKGHIAFNFPGESAEDSRTRLVNLDEPTIEANKRYFDDDPEQVPKQAVTVGLATIMEARKILVLVNGEHKAQEVHDALESDKSVQECPAVILRNHPDVTWVGDDAALSKLSSSLLSA